MKSLQIQHQLHCHLDIQTGSLERLLRMIRVRGYCVQSMSLDMQKSAYLINLIVSGERAVDNLLWQLRKLADVHSVELGPYKSRI